MNNGATNVDHNIEVCIAQLKAGERELEPQSKIRIAIGKYLMEHPTATIIAEQNKAIDTAKRAAAKKERDKKSNKEKIRKAVENYTEEQGDNR